MFPCRFVLLYCEDFVSPHFNFRNNQRLFTFKYYKQLFIVELIKPGYTFKERGCHASMNE